MAKNQQFYEVHTRVNLPRFHFFPILYTQPIQHA